MTETYELSVEEAIEILRFQLGYYCDLKGCEEQQAFAMAIKALKKDPCEDAVSRQAVKEEMIKYGFHAPDMTVTEFVEDCLSPVNPQPKTGHWIYIRNSEVNGLKIVECSECGKRTYGSGNYCPTCGIKMESSEKLNKSEIPTVSEQKESEDKNESAISY